MNMNDRDWWWLLLQNELGCWWLRTIARMMSDNEVIVAYVYL
jgi:hypothetical protein